MDITFAVEDPLLEGFSEEAKKSLTTVCSEYAVDIIREAKRIEQNDRVTGSKVEVIASHIREAKRIYRKAPRRNTGIIVAYVILDILLIALGIMFDKTKLLNSTWYLLIYIAIAIITIVLEIVKYSKEVSA